MHASKIINTYFSWDIIYFYFHVRITNSNLNFKILESLHLGMTFKEGLLRRDVESTL